jgi:hypothetical protein
LLLLLLLLLGGCCWALWAAGRRWASGVGGRCLEWQLLRGLVARTRRWCACCCCHRRLHCHCCCVLMLVVL